MINWDVILERVESLFTKIPIDASDLSEQALKEVQAGFHFAQAQFWVFFLLIYVGFAAMMGNRIGKWVNLTFVSIIGWFAMAVPPNDAVLSSVEWLNWASKPGLVYWLLLSILAFAAILYQDRLKSLAAQVNEKLKSSKLSWLFNLAIISSAIAASVIPNFEFNISYYLVIIVAYIVFSVIYDRSRMRSAYLMLVSLFFYWKVGAPFVYILLFSTVIDFYLGRAVYNANTDNKKRWFIAISMIVNLSVLLYFKYFNFFATEWNSLDLPSWMHIANAKENAIGIWLNGGLNANVFLESLPMVVGISYYTFQTMSYTIDIYRKQIKPLDNIIDFGFFVSFFPQLVAGPIVRASEFVPQIHKEYSLSKSEFGWSLYMILKGLIKKMIFADFIAVYFLDHVFASPDQFSGAANVLAIFGYSLQIYGDFAGYTDMAIGVARLFGFKLPTNFNSPYKSIHCGEFWKRWHITLSSWLRDYLYIPLGGNRGGTAASYIIGGLIISGVLYAAGSWQTTIIVMGVIATLAAFAWYSASFFNHINRNINVTLTMLLGGLWHGASWQFVIWGGLNGLGVLSTKYWLRFKEYYKIIAALVLAGIFYLASKSTVGNTDLWTLATYWSLIVAGIALWKTIFQLVFKPSGWSPFLYYSNAIYGMIHTLCFITFTRIYFRGETMDKISQFYHQVLHDFGDFANGIFIRSQEGDRIINPDWLYASEKTKDFLDYSPTILLVIVLGYLIHMVPSFIKKRIESGFSNSNVVIQALISVVVIIICYQAYSSDSAAFIYYQF